MATNNPINAPKPFAVGIGGTGDATLTDRSVLIGRGTSPVEFAATQANSNAILMSQGAAVNPAFTTSGTPWVSGISFNGGTNTMIAYVSGNQNYGVAIGGVNTGITYVSQGPGFYYRIGGLCTCAIPIYMSSTGGLVGAVTVTGLPFACDATFGENYKNEIILTNVTLAAGYTSVYMVPNVGTTTAQLIQYNNATGAAPIALTNTEITNTTSITGIFHYPASL